MTKFKTVTEFTNTVDYRKDLEKALAKTRRPNEIVFCKKFAFGNKTGPLLVVGPIDKKLVAALKKDHGGKEGRCARNAQGGFELLGHVTADDFEKAMTFIGVDPAAIADEGDDAAGDLDRIHGKRVERALREFGDRDAIDQGVGEDIAHLFETEEDVRRQVETEKDLFGRFGKDFDSFETMAKSLTPSERKELDAAMRNMIRRAEQRHAELFGSKRELTADDLDELIAVFSHIPRGLVPPRFKKELQDWRATRDAMQQMAIAELMKQESTEVVGSVRNVLDAITAPTAVVTKVGELIGGEDFERAKKAIETASTALDTISKGLGVLQAGKDRLSGEQRTALERRMANKETIDALTELADTALELGGDFVPIVSTINNGKNVVLNGVTTFSRINKAIADGTLRDLASRDAASQLARALGQSCSREKRLAAEAGAKTVTSALGVASDVSMVGDAGALKVVNGVLKVGSKVVFKVADAMSDTKAATVLKAARAGDERAQQEVFGRHAHYAKYLLALAATKGDRLARSYFVERGLTEQDIAENSAEILMKFGLQESQETAAPQTIPDQLRDQLQKAADAASRLGTAISTGLKKAWSYVTGAAAAPEAAPPPAEEFEKLFTVQVLQFMTSTLAIARKQKAAMGQAPAPPWLDSNIRSLQQALQQAHEPLRKYYGVLTDELAASASLDDAASLRKVEVIRAQRAPLEESLRYLADAGYL